jgi:hypothetical protein
MSRVQRVIRVVVSIATALAMATVGTVAVATSAQATDLAAIPAYGVITIANDGTGAVPVWTYDAALWSCSTEIQGQYTAPTAVIVTCRASEGTSFGCPLMILTTQTGGPAARAGGRVSCTYTTLDTGIIGGFNSAQRTGSLGRALWIECAAYSDIPLIPPYAVTCNEPGPPTF